MSKIHRLRVLSLALTLALLFCLAGPCFAASGAASAATSGLRCVRVGLAEYPAYAYRDADGNLAGVDVEMAYRLGQYANVQIEITLLADAQASFRALDDGTVDVLFDVMKTGEREQQYLFSALPDGSAPVTVYTRTDDDRFTFGDSMQLNGRNVAVEKGSGIGELFLEWCAKQDVQPVLQEYADQDAMNAAVDSGEADVGVLGTDTMPGYRAILTLPANEYYLLMRRTDADLKRIIDDAMVRLKTEDPLYTERLIRKYTHAETLVVDAYTKQEQEYLEKHPQIIVAVVRGDEPYFSQTGGKQHGILVDYYTHLAGLMGCSFRFAEYPTDDAAQTAVAQGDADVLGMFSGGLVAAAGLGLRLTRSYASVNAVQITRAGTDAADVHTVAVKQRSESAVRQSLNAAAGMELVDYNSASECFAALRAKKVDAMICGMPSATWLINQTNSTAYSISAINFLSLELCGAVAYSNSTLCSLLDKGIRANENYFDSIAANNTLPETGWRTFLARIPVLLTISVAAVLLVLALGLAFSMHALVRRQREAAAIAAARAENERRELQLAAAERSNAERNRFFSTISHDMRTPLNAIIGFAGLAQKKNVSPEVRADLDKICTSGILLLDLINDTLTVSKMNSGTFALDVQPVDSAALLDSILVPIGSAAGQKGVAFRVQNEVPRRTLLTDRLSVQKIFLNLLSNAVKYTPRGGHVTFALRRDSADSADPDTVFTVSDDGIGISKAFLDHIYEPFSQENQTGRQAAGTGLGLSIVKELVDTMGGTIHAESEQGKGTTFTVRLHFALAPEQQHSTQTAAGSRAGTAALAGKHVLLCEDNALNTEIACALLREKDMQVTCAADGRAGVELFAASAPGAYDAVLMDVRMPVMNGYAAAQAIRALERPDAKTVLILAMTADAFADDVQKSCRAGMNGHLAKPVDPDKLYAALADGLAAAGKTAETAAAELTASGKAAAMPNAG